MEDKTMRKTAVVILFILGTFVLFQSAMAQESAKAEAPAAPEAQEVEKAEIIRVKEVEPFYYGALEMTGSYEQHATAFPTLYQEAAAQALAIDGEPFGVYWNDPETTPEADLKWELGFPMSEKKGLAAPLKLKKWEFKHLVSKRYEGQYESEEMGDAYKEIFDWIGKNGYVPAGPCMEKYLNMPSKNAEGKWAGKVEILIPVEKAE